MMALAYIIPRSPSDLSVSTSVGDQEGGMDSTAGTGELVMHCLAVSARTPPHQPSSVGRTNQLLTCQCLEHLLQGILCRYKKCVSFSPTKVVSNSSILDEDLCESHPDPPYVLWTLRITVRYLVVRLFSTSLTLCAIHSTNTSPDIMHEMAPGRV